VKLICIEHLWFLRVHLVSFSCHEIPVFLWQIGGEGMNITIKFFFFIRWKLHRLVTFSPNLMNNDPFPQKIIHFYHHRPAPKWKERSTVICTVLFSIRIYPTLKNMSMQMWRNSSQEDIVLKIETPSRLSFRIFNGVFTNPLHGLVIIFTGYVKSFTSGRAILASTVRMCRAMLCMRPGNHNWCSARVVFYALYVLRVTKSHVREHSYIYVHVHDSFYFLYFKSGRSFWKILVWRIVVRGVKCANAESVIIECYPSQPQYNLITK